MGMFRSLSYLRLQSAIVGFVNVQSKNHAVPERVDPFLNHLAKSRKKNFGFPTYVGLNFSAQTQGWNAVADAGGVPVWAADTLAFRGSGGKMKVTK